MKRGCVPSGGESDETCSTLCRDDVARVEVCYELVTELYRSRRATMHHPSVRHAGRTNPAEGRWVARATPHVHSSLCRVFANMWWVSREHPSLPDSWRGQMNSLQQEKCFHNMMITPSVRNKSVRRCSWSWADKCWKLFCRCKHVSKRYLGDFRIQNPVSALRTAQPLYSSYGILQNLAY